MKCAVCEREFTAQRKTRKFCSDRCRLKNHRPNMIKRYNELVKFTNDLLHDLEVRENQIWRLIQDDPPLVLRDSLKTELSLLKLERHLNAAAGEYADD